MSPDVLNLDVSSLSKLFISNDFENLNLMQYQLFKNCFNALSNNDEDSHFKKDAFFLDESHEAIARSPCKNPSNYSVCKDYCRWHDDLFKNKLTKHEFLTLMR